MAITVWLVAGAVSASAAARAGWSPLQTWTAILLILGPLGWLLPAARAFVRDAALPVRPTRRSIRYWIWAVCLIVTVATFAVALSVLVFLASFGDCVGACPERPEPDLPLLRALFLVPVLALGGIAFEPVIGRVAVAASGVVIVAWLGALVAAAAIPATAYVLYLAPWPLTALVLTALRAVGPPLP